MVKEQARAELAQLPPDVLTRLLKKFGPFIKNMPAGHGKGHMFRDAIHLTGMFQDPEYTQKPLDEVEIFTGIMGGMFHDIGNSIVNRYDDAKRLGAHAEVGAVLFGDLAKDILPPHLTKLIQYTIAAHTHYPPGQEVTLANGEKEKRQDYNDTVSGEQDRLAMWFTRQTDRRDTTNIPFLFRNYLLRTKPIQDFNGEKFDDEAKDSAENFRTQFSVEPEYIDKGVINHAVMFAKNVFKYDPDKKPCYTSHDTEYYTRHLMTPGLSDIALFLDVVAPGKRDEMLKGIAENEKEAMGKGKWKVERDDQTSAHFIQETITANKDTLQSIKTDPLSEPVIEGVLKRFIQLAQVIEPAADLTELTTTLQLQFLGGEVTIDGQKKKVEPVLSRESQTSLARGLLLLCGPLFEGWRTRLAEEIKNNPQLDRKTTSSNEKAQKVLSGLGTDLQKIAKEELKEIDFPERKTK